MRRRIADLVATNGGPNVNNALKARARELQRLSLASEVKRNGIEKLGCRRWGRNEGTVRRTGFVGMA